MLKCGRAYKRFHDSVNRIKIATLENKLALLCMLTEGSPICTSERRDYPPWLGICRVDLLDSLVDYWRSLIDSA